MKNSTCWTYSWLLTDWTSCRPSGLSSCGPGLQTRGQRCVRSDGRPVSPDHCHHLSVSGDTKVSCTVDCPVDCLLSPWSDWDPGQCQCGEQGLGRNLTRRRHVLVPASPTGRPCPQHLHQHKPCPASPCHQWRLGPWSQCHLQGAACGTGTMTRNVSCVLSGTDKEVEESLCRTNVSSPDDLMVVEVGREERRSSRSCYVSCDQDCTVSEWSQWSACAQETCLPRVSVGWRERSRQVVQAARQPHGKCSPGLHQTGSVHCHSSLTSLTLTLQLVSSGAMLSVPVACQGRRCFLSEIRRTESGK